MIIRMMNAFAKIRNFGQKKIFCIVKLKFWIKNDVESW